MNRSKWFGLGALAGAVLLTQATASAQIPPVPPPGTTQIQEYNDKDGKWESFATGFVGSLRVEPGTIWIYTWEEGGKLVRALQFNGDVEANRPDRRILFDEGDPNWAKLEQAYVDNKGATVFYDPSGRIIGVEVDQ